MTRTTSYAVNRYRNVAVPFQQRGNRQVITHKQMLEHRWLREFVERWEHCFEYDMNADVYVFDPAGKIQDRG